MKKQSNLLWKEPDINYLRDGFCHIRILDKAVYDGVEDASSVMDTVGSGMPRLAEYETGEYYKPEAVEDYFRGTPAVKKAEHADYGTTDTAVFTGTSFWRISGKYRRALAENAGSV